MTKVCVSCSQDTCWGRNVISVCWSGREGERERCPKVGTRELEEGAEMFVRRGSCEVCEGKEICHDAYIGGGGQHQGWTLSKRFDLWKHGQFHGKWFVASDGLKDEGAQIGSWSILSERKTYLLIWRCHIWVQLPYESLLCLKAQQHTFAVTTGNKGTLSNIHWQVHLKVSQICLWFVQENTSQVFSLDCKYTFLFLLKTTYSVVDSSINKSGNCFKF